jgi:hypothetical protein
MGKHLPSGVRIRKSFSLFCTGKGRGAAEISAEKRIFSRDALDAKGKVFDRKVRKGTPQRAQRKSGWMVRVAAGENLQSKIINLKFFRLDVP